jgi:molybdate transport system ATP-binding protein
MSAGPLPALKFYLLAASKLTMTPLIELNHAHVFLESHEVLSDLEFRLERGEHWAVLGGNGAGKSTFLRLLAGQIWCRPHDARLYTWEGITSWSPLRAREHIALLSPELQNRYVHRLQDGPDNEKGWQLSVEECVWSGFFDSQLLHQKPTQAQRLETQVLMHQVGIGDWAQRPLQTLSQGQMRRVLLARSLVRRPALLLLDEACSGLDRKSRVEFLEALQGIAEAGETQIVMTTHRPQELVPAISNILRLRHGRIVLNVPRSAWKPEESARNPSSIAALARPEASATLAPLLRLNSVSVYVEGAPVLSHLNWELRRGEHWVISGSNGAGKSTFLRLLRGELAPARGGTIERFGSTKLLPVWEIGRKISLFSPALQARFRDEMPIEAAMGSGFAQVLGRAPALTPEQSERVQCVMELCNLRSLAGKLFGRLSYGQTRRVLLARALVAKPQVLLLDEALDGLDASGREEMNDLLLKLARQGTTLVVVSHHEEDWPAFATHHLALRDGQIERVEAL